MPESYSGHVDIIIITIITKTIYEHLGESNIAKKGEKATNLLPNGGTIPESHCGHFTPLVNNQISTIGQINDWGASQVVALY